MAIDGQTTDTLTHLGTLKYDSCPPYVNSLTTEDKCVPANRDGNTSANPYACNGKVTRK